MTHATKHDRSTIRACAAWSAAGTYLDGPFLRRAARAVSRDGINASDWLRRLAPRDRQRLAQMVVAL